VANDLGEAPKIFSFSAFQHLSFYPETLPPLVDFPFLREKTCGVAVVLMWIPRRAGNGLMERQLSGLFNDK
jgi:hypothetical protein